LFDRVRTLVNPDLSGSDTRLFEPTLDCLQRMHQGSVRLAAKLYLNLAVRLERDALAVYQADQVNDEELRALDILCRNPDHHHDPLLGATAVTELMVLLISEPKNAISKIRN
jgi:hypothetical protein